MSHKGGFKLLLTAEDDPEFRNYCKNIIKDFLAGLDAEYVGKLVAEMITSSSGSGVSKIDDFVRAEVKSRINSVFPTYTGWGSSEKIKKDLDIILREVIRERIDQIATKAYIDSMIEKMIQERLSKFMVSGS